MTIKKLIISDRKIVKMCAKESSTKHSDAVPKHLERCVNRLRNSNMKKFQAMCKMHLSFLLDLPNLEELLNESQVDVSDVPSSKNGKKSFSQFTTKRKSKPFHNCSSLPLTEDYVTNVYQLVQYLGQPHNICQEGLFRKTGQLSRQKELKSRLVSGEPLYLDNGTFSAHDCASVLKSYLGDLQEPLLTEKYYKAHRQVPEMMPGDPSDLTEDMQKLKLQKQVKTVQLLVLLLPSVNAAVLSLILDLLHRVSLHQQNKMTADNLGTLFAPHILCPREITAGDLQSVSSSITKSVSFMVEHAPKLFQVPVDLARDIANYWKQMEEDPGVGAASRPVSGASMMNETVDMPANMTFGIPMSRNESSLALNTCVRFVDQEASEKARKETDTETALAQLYAHVQSMPESSRKKKLLKQFNKTNGGVVTPSNDAASTTFFNRTAKSMSIYGSIRKRFGKRSKKEMCNQSLNVSKENMLSSQSEEEEEDEEDEEDYLTVDWNEGISLTPQSTISTEGKVCIVDMNQTAPSILSPQKRKFSGDMTSQAKKSCTAVSHEPKTARKVEALLSPIPHRASAAKQLTPKQQNLSRKCTMPLSVFQSPDYTRNQSLNKSKLEF